MRKWVLIFFISLLFLLNFISAAPPIKNAIFENVNVTNNLTVGGNATATYGFFESLGSSISRITKGWFTGLNVVDLVVDTNTLFVDSTNDRVGIGTITPQNTLDVVGVIRASTSSAEEIILDARPPNQSSFSLGIHSNEYPSICFYDGQQDCGGNWSEIVADPGGINYGLGNYLLFNHEEDVNGVIFNDGNYMPFVKINTEAKKLEVVGTTNSTGGFIVGANTGITGSYSIGNCWFDINGGIITSTNCTAF